MSGIPTDYDAAVLALSRAAGIARVGQGLDATDAVSLQADRGAAHEAAVRGLASILAKADAGVRELTGLLEQARGAASGGEGTPKARGATGSIRHLGAAAIRDAFERGSTGEPLHERAYAEDAHR